MGLNRMYGAAWNAKVQESEWLIPAGNERLFRLKADELLVRYPEVSAKKVLLIGIEETNGIFQVSCREYDTRVQEMSPVLTEQSGEEQTLRVPVDWCEIRSDPSYIFRANRLLFQANWNLKCKAAHCLLPDPSAAFIRTGDIYKTFLRQMDRRNPDKLKVLQRLDLCYVRVTGFNDELRADAPDRTVSTCQCRRFHSPFQRFTTILGTCAVL